jgi:hypothetical protein
VYVTDRFGEVFSSYRATGGETLPSVVDILNWLEFVNAMLKKLLVIHSRGRS